MARAGISEKQVFAAADALTAAGEKPTLKSMRERLGTGSPNTIHRLLRTWRASRPASAETTRTLPVGLVEAIHAELAAAETRLRAELAEELAEARREAEQLANAGEAREDELEERAMQLAALTSERDRLDGKCAEQAAAVARLGTELERARAELEGQRQRAEVAREHLEEARARLTTLESAREDGRVKVAQLEQANAVLEVERRTLAERVEESKQKAGALADDLKGARAAEAALAQTLAGERARVEALRAELDTVRTLLPSAALAKGKNGTLHLPRKG